MHRKSVALVVAATLVALSLPFTFALAATAFAQEPEPPTGEPQPTPEEPDEPDQPDEPETVPEEPAPEGPAGEQPAGSEGTLPHTGWDALAYFAGGVLLLLAGARLRVLTRIREVSQRVSARIRRRPSEVALREALEPIRAARLSRAPEDPGPLHVEPSTPTARRLTGVGERD